MSAFAKTPDTVAAAPEGASWKRGLFWLALAPIVYLPHWLRYRLSDLIALVLRYVLRYRKAVINANLLIAFPEKSDAERKALRFGFYRNFGDLIVEQIWAFGATREQVLKMVSIDADCLASFAQYQAQGRPVMLAAGHHNNYELGAATIAMGIDMPMATIYARLLNPFFDARVRESRGRFGMTLWPRGQTAKRMAEWREAHGSFAVGFAFDQSPHAGRPKYWLPFFGRPTGVQMGLDLFAREQRAAVMFLWVSRTARGRYQLRGLPVCDDASQLDPGVASAVATGFLEQLIRQEPAGWMWSHRRWKLDMERDQLPEDIVVDPHSIHLATQAAWAMRSLPTFAADVDTSLKNA